MDNTAVEIRRSLLPLSWLYGIGVSLRNWMFNHNILKQKSFDTPIICVGNITVGGTGKTPHTEYLIRLLSKKYKVAVLSRGYKRKSKGYRIVNVDSRVEDVGDEPLQMKQKYPDTLVVVDKKRVRAIEKLQSLDKGGRPDVILLDDGFQHRHVRPSLSILLVDSNRPVFEDKLLPAGLLREHLSAKSRASMVLVTKCKPEMQPIDFRVYTNGLELYPFQSLHFTSLSYGAIKPVFPELGGEKLQLDDLRKKHLFLVTGIASPAPLVDKLEQKTYNLYTKFFPDHHAFTKDDIQSISDLVDTVEDAAKIIVTTEKDAVRFRALPFLSEDIKRMLYYIPIQIMFIDDEQQQSFNKKIENHVRNYQTNSRLPG